jgi:transposase
VLFKPGRGKQGQWDVQFQAMVGSIDPLGLPLAVDVVAGDKAEDPLYVPCYRRIKQTLDRDGLLVIGDAKMSALETRGTMAAGHDYYLTPLANIGEVPTLLAEWLQPVWDEQQALTAVFLPEEGPAPDPELAIAHGFVVNRRQQVTIAGRLEVWQERCLVLRSTAYAQALQAHFWRRVTKAEQALRDLTPRRGRGKRQITAEATLQAKIQAIVEKYQAEGWFDVHYERQVSRRQVRAYRGQEKRVEEQVRYQITVQRNQAALTHAERLLGWRVYATNAPADRLTLSDAVLAYRDQYVVERVFSRLKGRRLSITPLYVQRDDHALGLIRLLTLAVRLLALSEYTARKALAETQSELSGIYAGNPARSTARPTTERLLRRFQQITLTTVHLPDREVCQLTPLTAVQNRILALLGLSPSLYIDLASA